MKSIRVILSSILIIIYGNVLYAQKQDSFSSRMFVIQAGSIATAGWYCGDIYRNESGKFRPEPGFFFNAGYRLYRGLTVGGHINYMISLHARPFDMYEWTDRDKYQYHYILSGGPSLRYYFDLGRCTPFAGFAYGYSTKNVEFIYPSLFSNNMDTSVMTFDDHRHSFITTTGITVQVYKNLGVFIAYDFDYQKIKRDHIKATGNAPDECFIYADENEGKIFTGYLHRFVMGVTWMI